MAASLKNILNSKNKIRIMMKTFIQDKQYGKRLLGMLTMLAVAVLAWGDNITVSMSDFSIAPGETYTVSIDVTSDVRCGSGFSGTIDLPDGLDFVAGEDGELIAKNAARISDHTLSYATKDTNPKLGENQLFFNLFSYSGKNLKELSGTVLSFTVKATAELAEDSQLRILEYAVARNDGSSSDKGNCSANVHNSAFVATVMNLSAQPFSLTPTKEYDLTFAFEKNKEVSAFQADINLPDGLSFKMIDEEDEDYVKFDASRLAADHSGMTSLLNGGKTMRVLLMSATNKNMKLDDGNLFTIRVKATAELAATSDITVSKIEFVQSDGTKFTPEGFSIAVTNPDVAAKADADEKIAELKTGFESAEVAAAATAESVQNLVKDDIDNLREKINAIDAALAQDVANGDVAVNAETREAAIAEATALLAALNTKMADAQAAYEANEAQHTADLEAIAEVQTALDNAKAEIEKLTESVQAGVAEDIAAAETAVDALTTTAEASYAAGTSVADAETLAADIAAAKAQIEALSKKAADAQAAYDANEAQHTADLEAIAEVQTALDNAKAEIEKLTESVQADVADDITAAETAVDALTTTAEASYAAGTSVADAETLAADIAAAKAQIEALSKKAADAQAAYDANEAQHTADLEAIEDVQTKLDAAKATVAGYVESVQSAFAETITTLETSIAGLTTTAENSYNNGTSVADAAALQENIAAVVADIDRLLADAAAAQQAYDANEAQHTADLAAIAAAETKLGEVMETIDGYSQSVQDDMAEAEAAAQSKIEELKAAAEKSYTEGTSVADKEAFNAAIAALHTQIDNLAADAEAAQNGYDANEAQHSKDLAAIEEVKAALDAAKAEIAKLAESVQAGVAEDIKAAEDAVAALTTAAEASYAAGTSVADAETLAAAIADANAQIDALKKKAADNQAAYEANEAQHTADLASIEDVQAKFDAVKDKISGYEQSVQELVAEDIARIQQLIDEASAAAEKSYAEGTSVADAEVLKAQIMAIEAQITALDTKAAFEQEKAYLRGDIDETGKVDINDLAIIRDLILGKSDAEELTEKQQQAADLNGDGKYSVVDLVMLNNVIVYGNPDGPAVTNAKDATLAGMESGSLSMKIEAGRMDIALNSGMPYAAIQMDITMPEGISMDDMTFAGTSDKVIIARNVLENGVCRILMYTADNSVMIDRETSLLSIKLAGNGDGIVSIDNIIAATSRGEGRALAAINGNFTIVTGINAVGTDNMSETSVFDTNGIKRQTMRKGINIVRDAAGRVKKVLVK